MVEQDGIDHEYRKKLKEIGVVVGDITDTYEFVISDLSASVGDIVITKSSTPMIKDVLVWEELFGWNEQIQLFHQNLLLSLQEKT